MLLMVTSITILQCCCMRLNFFFTVQTQAINAAAAATKRLPTTCHQQAMGFSIGVTAAGGNVVARGVATLAPLQPLPSLPQALDDAVDDTDVEEDDDDEIEIVPQQYEEEAEAEEDTQQAEEDTEPVEEPAMVEPSKISFVSVLY